MSTLADYIAHASAEEARIDLAAQARALYEAGAPTGPGWDQLGDVTRGVWIERAELMNAEQPANPQPGDIL